MPKAYGISCAASWQRKGRKMISQNTQHSDASEKRTYLVEDIEKILGIGRSSAYELVKQGHFKTVRIGTAIRVSKKSFDEWLDSQEASS